jgi:hypothetical protein
VAQKTTKSVKPVAHKATTTSATPVAPKQAN